MVSVRVSISQPDQWREEVGKKVGKKGGLCVDNGTALPQTG